MANKLNQFTTHSSQFTNFAFTLAETLIVMGIIGVVAALTLPNLNSSTGDKEKVAKVKKIYSNLNDAFGRAQAVYGPYDEWFKNDNDYASQSTRSANRMTEFMKISKSCTNWSGCMTSNTTNPLANFDDCDLPGPSYILSDGIAISFKYNKFIIVDIDGPKKGSFTMGKDIFLFEFKNNELLPGYLELMHSNPGEYCWNEEGLGCSTWVIENGNMDYLKATNGTCPNGTVLSWTNTTCK